MKPTTACTSAPQSWNFFSDGVCDGAAHAAADDADLLLALGFGGLAERADEILQEIALLLVAELFGGGADGLDR